MLHMQHHSCATSVMLLLQRLLKTVVSIQQVHISNPWVQVIVNWDAHEMHGQMHPKQLP